MSHAPTVDPRDTRVILNQLSIEKADGIRVTDTSLNWLWSNPYANGTATTWPFNGFTASGGTTSERVGQEDIDELFPIEDSALDAIAEALANKGPSTYFPGPPRLAGSCPPGQHEFELVEEDVSLLPQKPRVVLYCHKCGTTVRHDISAPQEDTDDQSVPDD